MSAATPQGEAGSPRPCRAAHPEPLAPSPAVCTPSPRSLTSEERWGPAAERSGEEAAPGGHHLPSAPPAEPAMAAARHGAGGGCPRHGLGAVGSPGGISSFLCRCLVSILKLRGKPLRNLLCCPVAEKTCYKPPQLPFTLRRKPLTILLSFPVFLGESLLVTSSASPIL